LGRKRSEGGEDDFLGTPSLTFYQRKKKSTTTKEERGIEGYGRREEKSRDSTKGRRE